MNHIDRNSRTFYVMYVLPKHMTTSFSVQREEMRTLILEYLTAQGPKMCSLQYFLCQRQDCIVRISNSLFESIGPSLAPGRMLTM